MRGSADLDSGVVARENGFYLEEPGPLPADGPTGAGLLGLVAVAAAGPPTWRAKLTLAWGGGARADGVAGWGRPLQDLQTLLCALGRRDLRGVQEWARRQRFPPTEPVPPEIIETLRAAGVGIEEGTAALKVDRDLMDSGVRGPGGPWCPVCLTALDAEASMVWPGGCTDWLHRRCYQQMTARGHDGCPVCRRGLDGQWPPIPCGHGRGACQRGAEGRLFCTRGCGNQCIHGAWDGIAPCRVCRSEGQPAAGGGRVDVRQEGNGAGLGTGREAPTLERWRHLATRPGIPMGSGVLGGQHDPSGQPTMDPGPARGQNTAGVPLTTPPTTGMGGVDDHEGAFSRLLERMYDGILNLRRNGVGERHTWSAVLWPMIWGAVPVLRDRMATAWRRVGGHPEILQALNDHADSQGINDVVAMARFVGVRAPLQYMRDTAQEAFVRGAGIEVLMHAELHRVTHPSDLAAADLVQDMLVVWRAAHRRRRDAGTGAPRNAPRSAPRNLLWVPEAQGTRIPGSHSGAREGAECATAGGMVSNDRERGLDPTAPPVSIEAAGRTDDGARTTQGPSPDQNDQTGGGDRWAFDCLDPTAWPITDTHQIGGSERLEIPAAAATELIRHGAGEIVVAARAHELLESGVCNGERCLVTSGDARGCGNAVAAALGLFDSGRVAAIRVVCINLNGTMAQRLIAGLRGSGILAEVLLFTFSARGGGGTGPLGPEAAVLAFKAWGTRVVQMAREVAPVGTRDMTLVREGRRQRGMVLGMVVRVDPTPVITRDPPVLLCRGFAGVAPRVWALVQGGADRAFREVLYRARWEVDVGGGHLEVRTDTLRPGSQPGMDGPEAWPVHIHTIIVHGRHGGGCGRGQASLRDAVRQLLHPLEGSTGPGDLVSTWTEDDLRDTLLLHVPRGAVPTVVEALRDVQAQLGGKTVVINDVVGVLGIAPAMVGGLVESAGIGRWMGGLWPVARIEVDGAFQEPRGSGSVLTVPVRVRHGEVGQDHQWLVDGGDGLELGLFAQAAIRHTGTRVNAAPVQALDEQSGAYRYMVLLRTGGEGVAAMEALVASARGLRVGSGWYRVLRYTHVRPAVSRVPTGESPATLLHRATDRARGRPGRRDTEYDLTVARVAADGEGRALECTAGRPARGREDCELLTHYEGGLWEGARAGGTCRRFRQHYLGVLTEIWTWGEGPEPVAPGTPAPEITREAAVDGLGRVLRAVDGGDGVVDGERIRMRGTAGQAQEIDIELVGGQATCVPAGAGSRVDIFAPGQICTVSMLRPGWVRVGVPTGARDRCARDGVSATVRVRVQGAGGAGWVSPDPAARLAPGIATRGGGGPAGSTGLASAADTEAAPSTRGRGSTIMGLTAWIGDGLARQVVMETEEAQAVGVECRARRAAEVILGHYWPSAVAAWAPVMGRWIREHVQEVLATGPPAAWQWPVVILAWLMEQAGICGEFERDREHAEDLLQEAGFSAAALRQLPFRGWCDGRRGCQPGAAFPGMRAARGQLFARIHMVVPDTAVAALNEYCQQSVAAASGPTEPAAARHEGAGRQGLEPPAPVADLRRRLGHRLQQGGLAAGQRGNGGGADGTASTAPLARQGTLWAHWGCERRARNERAATSHGTSPSGRRAGSGPGSRALATPARAEDAHPAAAHGGGDVGGCGSDTTADPAPPLGLDPNPPPPLPPPALPDASLVGQVAIQGLLQHGAPNPEAAESRPVGNGHVAYGGEALGSARGNGSYEGDEALRPGMGRGRRQGAHSQGGTRGRRTGVRRTLPSATMRRPGSAPQARRRVGRATGNNGIVPEETHAHGHDGAIGVGEGGAGATGLGDELHTSALESPHSTEGTARRGRRRALAAGEDEQPPRRLRRNARQDTQTNDAGAARETGACGRMELAGVEDETRSGPGGREHV